MLQLFLFFITSLLEIAGCYFSFIYFTKNNNFLYLIGSSVSLILFGYLLTLQNNVPGKTYLIYGGIYILSSYLCFIFIDQGKITLFDLLGIFLILSGTSLIYFQK